MEYKVASGVDIKFLCYEVDDLISKGWIPQGGVCFSEELSRFYQAMIRNKPT